MHYLFWQLHCSYWQEAEFCRESSIIVRNRYNGVFGGNEC